MILHDIRDHVILKRDLNEILNSARKATDLETMVVVNRYIEVMVRRILSMLARIICSCGDDTLIIQRFVPISLPREDLNSVRRREKLTNRIVAGTAYSFLFTTKK